MKGKIIGLFLSLIIRTSKQFDEELFELCVRLWSNQPPKLVGKILLHGRTEDDAEELFDFVAKFANENNTHVLINGSKGEQKGSNKPYVSWPGGLTFSSKLYERGVKNISLTERADTTVEESEKFLEYSIKRNLQLHSFVLVSWQHQMPRCFISMIKAMKKLIGNDKKMWPAIYCICPSNTKWLKTVRGSQGLNPLARKEHARLELLGIKQLLKNDPDLLSDTFEYLDLLEKSNRQ